ncbi:MAG: methyltransferase, partial [Halobacteriaceae archaeon]
MYRQTKERRPSSYTVTMPVIPNLMERAYMLRFNRGPGPMLDLFGGMALEAAMLGVDLGVFEALDENSSSPKRLADELDADETGIGVLLEYLNRAGYVEHRGNEYALTAMSETWLLPSSATSYDRYFRFWREVLYPYWREHAEDAIREGTPPRTVYEWLDDHPDRWPIAQAAFELTAELIGDDIAEALDLAENASVLDLGGGHGLYSIAICEQYPSVTATIFDAPEMADLARENVQSSDHDDRIEFVGGDYETDVIE